MSRDTRVLAAGAVFLTHTLAVASHPTPGGAVRAQAHATARGGSAANALALLAALRAGSARWLLAALGGDAAGAALIRELQDAGVSTRFCRVWPNLGVPQAWVLQAPGGAPAVVNHNPLPEMTHDDFVAALGPLLAPEHYPPPPGAPPPPHPHPHAAPFEWAHFEGRAVRTTRANMAGLDGLARERRWRARCVFSLDVGPRARAGVEALMPHADVIFLNAHYAATHFPSHARTPRAFLLAQAASAPPHALLIADWGARGAAALSVPTREYFQASGWSPPPPPPPASGPGEEEVESVRSVRSGSEFWAGRTDSRATSAFFSAGHSSGARRHAARNGGDGEDSDDSGGTEHGRAETRDGEREEGREGEGIVDEAGAHDAFVGAMIFALSRRLLPGAPYAPLPAPPPDVGDGRWRLDECLRFAIECAGRKARVRGWEGVVDAMAEGGWLET